MLVRRLGAVLAAVGAVFCLNGGVALAQETNKGSAAEVSSETQQSERDSGWELRLDLGIGSHSNPYYRSDAEGDSSKKTSSGVLLNFDPSFIFDAPMSEFLYVGGKLKLATTTVLLDNEKDSGDQGRTVLQPIVQGTVRMSPSESLSVELSDEFQTANVGRDFDKPRFYYNRAGIEGAYRAGAFGTSLRYDNTLLREDTDQPLFDSTENAVVLGLNMRLAPTWCGRNPEVGIDLGAGAKEFDGDVRFPTTTDENGNVVNAGHDNPKSHTFYSYGARCEWPVAPLFTVRLRGGMTHRKYDFAYGLAKEETDSPYGGFSVEYLPSESPFSFTWANSYEVSDTMIYNTPIYDRVVFDAADPLINSLQIEYRQMEVLRTGLSGDFTSGQISVGLAGTYQQARSDKEEDLAPNAGNDSGEDAAQATDQRSVTLGASVRYQMRAVSVGLTYQHGFAKEYDPLPGKDDAIYQYDAVMLAFRADIGYRLKSK